jgi:hypothetical protein
MKTGIKLQRLSAAIASVAMSLAIVCSISAYAYPGASASRQAMMAKKSAFPAKVVMPSMLSLPLATCKGCAPG